ncbi:MAG TPA: type II toxin-antitoxin system RelE/ParE family toxin [Acidobacteriaceae bacterium]|nr:type II toxin-antitoxin system RelE/ParE family toxin [Acidobacteriaceae bacterium]
MDWVLETRSARNAGRDSECIWVCLYLAQFGRKHISAKPLKGFGSAGILEVVEDFDGSTYRAVYTVRFANAVYVLHCFQKKSKHGIATPKPDLMLIESRLKAAEFHSRGGSK